MNVIDGIRKNLKLIIPAALAGLATLGIFSFRGASQRSSQQFQPTSVYVSPTQAFSADLSTEIFPTQQLTGLTSDDIYQPSLHANGTIVAQHKGCFYYSIPKGATIYSLSKAFGDNYIVPRNGMSDSNYLRAGGGLTICADSVVVYEVARGDTLFSIARRFGTSVDALRKANGISPNSSLIHTGQTLYVP